jgi:AcrR family transcriptional regulator
MEATSQPVNVTPLDTERRAQIIAAAGRAFACKGYHRTTVKDIAAEAGLAPGTLYLYFPGKRDILVGFFDEVVSAAEAQMGNLAGLSLQEALETFLRDRLEALRDRGDVVKVILAEALYDRELQEKFDEYVLQRVRNLLVRLLEEHGARNLPKARLHFVVQALQAQVLYCGVLWPTLAATEPGNPARVAREITHLMMGGLSGLLKEAEEGGSGNAEASTGRHLVIGDDR